MSATFTVVDQDWPVGSKKDGSKKDGYDDDNDDAWWERERRSLRKRKRWLRRVGMWFTKRGES